MNTKQKGELSEAEVILAMLRRNWSVSKPFGDNQKYDLILDDGNGLKRVQVKTGRLKEGAILVNTTRSVGIWKEGSSRYREKYTDLEIDAFAVYCPDLNESFLISKNEVVGVQISLRVGFPKNNQKSKIRLASEYKI